LHIKQSPKYILKRGNGIPLYIQLRNQIILAISRGQIKVGDKMFTERELSSQLKVSRKTISYTYNILETLKVLKSHQGRGTFVDINTRGAKEILQTLGIHEKDSFSEKNSNDQVIYMRQSEMNSKVDVLVDFAFQHQISRDTLVALVKDRIQYRFDQGIEPFSVFVECNVEQASSFAKELEETANIQMDVCTLTQLRSGSKETHNRIRQSRNIVTTFNHLGEVKALLDQQGIAKNVFGVAITPNLESLIRIAKYPKGTKFGLVSLSEEFFFNVQSALKSGGIDQLDMTYTTSNDKDILKSFLQDLEAVIVSPGRYEEMHQMVNYEKDVISFDYKLDQGSVSVVTSKLK